MDKYINVAEICIAYKEDEVAAQYGGKNDIPTGVLFVLDTLELDMPESIVRCKDCIHRGKPKDNDYGVDVEFSYDSLCPFNCEDPWYSQRMGDEFYCSYGERRSEE